MKTIFILLITIAVLNAELTVEFIMSTHDYEDHHFMLEKLRIPLKNFDLVFGGTTLH